MKADFYYVGKHVYEDFQCKKPMFCKEHNRTQMLRYLTGVFKGQPYCMDCRRVEGQIVKERRRRYRLGRR